MKKTQTDTAPIAAPVVAPTVAITSLKDIQALCQQLNKVEFDYFGKQCVLEVRRLFPHEEAKINEIIEAVVPAIIKGKTPEEDRLDLNNPNYVKAKSEAALKARAQAIYWAVPAIQVDRPGLTDLNAVRDYVQSILTEPILDVLWQATRKTGIDLAELVNFT